MVADQPPGVEARISSERSLTNKNIISLFSPLPKDKKDNVVISVLHLNNNTSLHLSG